jgi:hypothetical protein
MKMKASRFLKRQKPLPSDVANKKLTGTINYASVKTLHFVFTDFGYNHEWRTGSA